jgi:hypothetical protein
LVLGGVERGVPQRRRDHAAVFSARLERTIS